MQRLIHVVALGLTSFAPGAVADDPPGRLVQLDLVAEGAMPRIGSYANWRVTLVDERPADLRRIPDDVTAPRFGVFEFGSLDLAERRVFVLVDEPADAPARLFVDANRNGDLADDPAPEWAAEKRETRDGAAVTRYSGGARVPDLDRHRDYVRSGSIAFGDESFDVMLDDAAVLGDFRGNPDGVELLIDVNGNGMFDVRGEASDITEPFNIGGTTYEVTAMEPDGSSFRLVVSDRHVDEIPPPPDLRAGRTILGFEATTLDGRPVRFPEDYRDRIVLLDLWATWCGPCVAEIPTLVAAYAAYSERGFDIVSVSIDEADERGKLEDFVREHEMAWTHVHDGGHWDGELVQLYCPGGIPAGYLVDGATGTILAALSNVRGEKLAEAIERALRDRHR